MPNFDLDIFVDPEIVRRPKQVWTDRNNLMRIAANYGILLSPKSLEIMDNAAAVAKAELEKAVLAKLQRKYNGPEQCTR